MPLLLLLSRVSISLLAQFIRPSDCSFSFLPFFPSVAVVVSSLLWCNNAMLVLLPLSCVLAFIDRPNNRKERNETEWSKERTGGWMDDEKKRKEKEMMQVKGLLFLSSLPFIWIYKMYCSVRSCSAWALLGLAWYWDAIVWTSAIQCNNNNNYIVILIKEERNKSNHFLYNSLHSHPPITFQSSPVQSIFVH